MLMLRAARSDYCRRGAHNRQEEEHLALRCAALRCAALRCRALPVTTIAPTKVVKKESSCNISIFNTQSH